MSETIEYTEKNIVNITIEIEGEAAVFVNGDPIGEEGIDPKNIVSMTLDHDGDVLVTINGEDFHIEKQKEDG